MVPKALMHPNLTNVRTMRLVEERSAHFQPYKSLIQKGRAKFCVNAVEDKSAVFHQGQETLR